MRMLRQQVPGGGTRATGQFANGISLGFYPGGNYGSSMIPKSTPSLAGSVTPMRRPSRRT